VNAREPPLFNSHARIPRALKLKACRRVSPLGAIQIFTYGPSLLQVPGGRPWCVCVCMCVCVCVCVCVVCAWCVRALCGGTVLRQLRTAQKLALDSRLIDDAFLDHLAHPSIPLPYLSELRSCRGKTTYMSLSFGAASRFIRYTPFSCACACRDMLTHRDQQE
jgi:hypothetical protein